METKETLEARFGPNPAGWPPPYRGSLQAGDDGRLHAALMAPGDETALTHAVLTRLALPHHGGVWALLPGFLSPRAALASYAGLWMTLAVIGYQGAGGFVDGATGGMLDDPLLAVVLGQVAGADALGPEVMP